MKTILATTYAVNPFKGSEDGMGWNFIYQIARYNKVIAITRKNNQAEIIRYMSENPDPIYDNINFLFFDLPKWAMFWKKGSRGALLYFYLWQRFVLNYIKKQKLNYDIVHNVNFHNDWTPSYLWKLGKPFVWGPIGHHPGISKEYLKSYSNKYYIKDRLTSLVKSFFWNFSFSLKKTKLYAKHIFCMNKSVPLNLKLTEGNYSITPSVATQDFGYVPKDSPDKFTVISAGRLVPLKGFDLTIKAFSKFVSVLSPNKKQKCELIIVGDGPELNNYKQMVKDLDMEDYVRFINWMDRSNLMNLYKQSSVFMFPSHEGAGMVVAEALSFGLPILCLDNCGPGEFIDSNCGIAVSYSDYDQTIKELYYGLSILFNSPNLYKSMSINARKRFESRFHWDVRGEEFRKVYMSI